MDVDAIEPGVDFVERIESAVASADVFLAIVGRGWVTAKDARGQRRLDNPNDFVRREVGAALARGGLTVIPVLVGGAVMPSPEELPEELSGITRRNALVLSDLDWRGGMKKLGATVEKTVGAEPRPPTLKLPEPAEPRRRPGRPEERREEPHEEKAPAATMLLGLAGAALVVAATALRWEALTDPDFGGGTVPNLGFVTAPASILVALGALYALVRAWTTGAGPLATGLLLGFAAGGVAKYGALLGQHQTSENPDAFGSGMSLVLGLVGSLVLAAVAASWLVSRHRQHGYRAVIGRVFAPVGALAIAVATFVPFNVSFPESDPTRQIIVQRDVWEAVDPFALAAAIVLTVFLGRLTKQLVVSGVLIALGLLGAAFWLRYVGVPALQMLERDDLASLRAGGFVGLAGAALVWRAGSVGRDRTLQQERAADRTPEQD
jgi:hypothetical protein